MRVSSLGVCGVRPPTTPSTPPSIPLDPIDSSLSSPRPTPLTPLPKPFYILHTKPPRPLGLSRLAHSPGNPSTGTCGPAAAITVPPQKKVPTSIRRRLRCGGRLRCPCCCCCSSTTADAGGSGAPAAIQAKILKPFFFSSCSCAAFSNLIKFCRVDRRVCVNTRMVGFWILWPSIDPTSKLRPNRTQPLRRQSNKNFTPTKPNHTQPHEATSTTVHVLGILVLVHLVLLVQNHGQARPVRVRLAGADEPARHLLGGEALDGRL